MNIDLSELTNFTENMAKVFSPAQQTSIMTVCGKRIGAAAMRYAAEYPEPSHKKLEKIYIRNTAFGRPTKPYKSKFKSDKQAYYVIFVLGKEGKIPYKRTGTLGKSMTSAIAAVSSIGVVVEVGTNIPYAALVIGDEGEQSKYHQGTWLTLPQRLDANAEKLRRVAVSAYTTEIDKRLS